MPARIDLSGRRFGRLTVLSALGLAKGKLYWNCVCDCGTAKIVVGDTLRNGKTRSCGCLKAEIMSRTKRTHGMSKSTEYHTYSGMLNRCYNQNNKKHPDYGGRRIVVCDRWRDSFENFYADMGKKPSGHTLDRIDVNGNYEPSNCRWATPAVQSRNTRRTIMLTHDGLTMCFTDWARKYNIPLLTAYTRYRKGLSFDEVFRRAD